MKPRYLTALPIFNEESHIVEVIDEVRRFSNDILVVDDGSSDETPDILASLEGVQIATHETNLGYGAALRTAFNFAIQEGYDVLVTIDCDGQHQPRLIPELADKVFPEDAEPVDIVSGSRYLQQFPGDSQPPEQRRQINVAITKLINEQLGMELTDGFCGFKAYRVDSLSHFEITELGYAMPLQLWVQAVKASLRITEFAVPLIYLEEERSFGGSLDDAQRRMAYYKDVLDREMKAASLNPTKAQKQEDIGSVCH